MKREKQITLVERLSKEQQRRNISISDSLLKKAKEIGKGNHSKGIRIAVEAYDKHIDI